MADPYKRNRTTETSRNFVYNADRSAVKPATALLSTRDESSRTMQRTLDPSFSYRPIFYPMPFVWKINPSMFRMYFEGTLAGLPRASPPEKYEIDRYLWDCRNTNKYSDHATPARERSSSEKGLAPPQREDFKSTLPPIPNLLFAISLLHLHGLRNGELMDE
uniref:Uncharacterized protein n=1 Tax=Vespula pensylvanica TaxID=30213 RepID=A0A834UCU5_VESPE|nr:hypothetical protein H0235_004281 [Vespula pensylvanica]